MQVSDDMVSRFLTWRLPHDFAPDCGVSFDGRPADAAGYQREWPVGTNLFTATQARAMLEHVLGNNQGPQASPRRIADLLRERANDPMWADHAEVSKALLLAAAIEIERRA